MSSNLEIKDILQNIGMELSGVKTLATQTEERVFELEGQVKALNERIIALEQAATPQGQRPS